MCNQELVGKIERNPETDREKLETVKCRRSGGTIGRTKISKVPFGISTIFIPMLLVISLGDWARTWQLTCIIPKMIKVEKNIEI